MKRIFNKALMAFFLTMGALQAGQFSTQAGQAQSNIQQVAAAIAKPFNDIAAREQLAGAEIKKDFAAKARQQQLGAAISQTAAQARS